MCTELGCHALTHHISAHSRLTVRSVHRTLRSQEYKRAHVLHSSGRTSACSDSVHVSSRWCQTAPANYNDLCAQVLWFLLQRRRAGGSQPAGSLSSFVVLVPGPLAAAALQPEVLTVSGARCCVRVSPRAAIVFSQGGIDTAALTAATRAPSTRGDVRNCSVDYGVVTEALETQIGTFP